MEERRERGLYPHFTERDIPLRTEPERFLPGARSVIVGAISYLTPHRPRGTVAGQRPKGTLSRYAWGLDYHPILRERLQRLADYVCRRLGPDVAYEIYVDTGPPVDREVAAEAGLGWFGKNAMLYAPRLGSWFFLGAIFLTAPLTPDPLVSLDCGDCTRCIDACPSGAIIEPYVVDPHRCLSHVTQMPGMIPEPLRDPLGMRVFGCDVCQQVCPWNDDAEVVDRPEFRPRDGVGAEPDLIAWLHMTSRQFRETIRPTAMGWRGKKTLQRNAAIALGNSRNPAAVPALAKALAEDRKPVVRQAAAWALGKIGGEDAAAALEACLPREKNDGVKEEIIRALQRARQSLPSPEPVGTGSPPRPPRRGAHGDGSRGEQPGAPRR